MAGGRPMGRLHQDDVRKKIQVSQLLNVLHDQAFGECDDLSPSRMKAIEILLRKSLPDLSAVTLTGEDGGPVLHRVERVIVDHATATDGEGL
jgi:hypothetical protein